MQCVSSLFLVLGGLGPIMGDLEIEASQAPLPMLKALVWGPHLHSGAGSPGEIGGAPPARR